VFIWHELRDLPLEFSAKAASFRNEGLSWPEEKLRDQQTLKARHMALNQALEKYIFRPRATYGILARAWLFGMVPDDNKRWFQITVGDQPISEADAVVSLVRLAETGDLGKVRLCEMCKENWYVRAKSHYKFCDDECRENYYAVSSDYHSRKAANQRRYRENLKRNQTAQEHFLTKREERETG
jgi:hypothetical protein